MAKDPVLPLYYNDITTSTQDWSDEEFGAYMRLLIHQWRQGGLPKDYQRLTRIATSLDRTWPLLKVKFEEVDGVLKNNNMELIRDKREKHKQKQKDNVEKRYQKSTKHSTKSVPLEKENEIENEKELKDKKSVDFEFQYELKEKAGEAIPDIKINISDKTQLIEALFTDEIYVEQLQMTHRGKNIKEAFEECYTHHSNAPNPPQEVWEWKQKLNTWLSIKRKDNGTGKKGTENNSRREAFNRRHGTGVGG
jgi:uncharacterized protein YdaU (DUF1376 family)